MKAFKNKAKRILAGVIALSMFVIPTTITNAGSDYSNFDTTGAKYGVIGDFNDWGEDLSLTDEDGDGIYEAIVSVPEIGSSYKVRANSSWDYCWGVLDENGFTSNSQINCSFDESVYGKDVTVYFDTRTGITGINTWYVGTDKPKKTPVANEDFDIDTPDGFSFKISGNTATLTKYIGDAQNVIIPSEIDGYAVTVIGSYSFYNYDPLTSVTIPNSVTKIEDSAFRYCSSLTSVTIPNSVNVIDNYAFMNCVSLYSVMIPDSIISVGKCAFSNTAWYNLQPDGIIYLGKAVYEYKGTMPPNTNIILKDGVVSIAENSFNNQESLISITIPNSVIKIGRSAFENCSSLTNVTIPKSVTVIENYAFTDCCALFDITIPDSVKSVGYGAFSGTAWYKSQPDGIVYLGKVAYKYKGFMPPNTNIILKDGTTVIADCAFEGKESLINITIPNSVTTIGSAAFACCSLLVNINIPNSVTKIGELAFSCCSSLKNIKIPNSVTEIGVWVFDDCWSLTDINVSSENNNYSSINGVLFNKEKTEIICCPPNKSGKFEIPNSVTSIGNKAFLNCSSLTSVIIPDSVTKIGECAFEHCISLKKVTIPNSVTKIKFRTFYDCRFLEKVTISNSVTEIEDLAFSYCSSLTSVTIPNSVTKIGSEAFSYCYLPNIVIPNSVTEIGDNAFDETVWYKRQPDGIVYAGNIAYKYKGKDKIPENTSLDIKNGTVGITKSAFSHCSSLKNITIPNSVKIIGANAFNGCSSLASVIILNSITKIGNFAFYDCDNLTIYSIKNSSAEIYAIKNNIPFNAITPLLNNSTITETDIKAGTAITLNAKATGGIAPYKYYYYCKAPGSNRYIAMKTDENATSRTTKPTVDGTYYYSVKIVDSNNNYKIKIFPVNVNEATALLTNNSTVTATNIKAGTAITLNAKATGGTAPYKYYYYCKAPGSNRYIVMKTDENTASRTTNPTNTGTYYYSVKIVDANGDSKIKILPVISS